MTRSSSQTYCTDATWLGRAHCGKCHIRHLMIFSELPESAFDQHLQPVDHFLFPPGSAIYTAGSTKKFIYSIRRGMVKLVHVAENGTERIVRLLGPGAVIGLELLNDADACHHTAIAVTQVDSCKIPLATVSQLESQFPDICNRLRDQLQSQLDLADQWIVALSTGTAKQRTAQLILVLEKYFSDNEGAFILLSRDDMAAMTGIASETISRTIAQFKRDDVLRKAHDNLYTCDNQNLQHIVDHV